MNTNLHLKNHANWLPLLLLCLSPAFGTAQIDSGPQAVPNHAESITHRISQPLQGTSEASAALNSSIKDSPVAKDYVIGVDDVLAINVWHEPDLSRSIVVRPDGKISLPLLGDVKAAGKTPPQLQSELQTDLTRFIKDPALTVIVAEIRSRRVNIIGQVSHPGTFALTQQMGVLDVIAEAGGLKEFAKQKDIYILRETSAGQRIRLAYDYRDVLRGKKNAQDILLQADDTVVVP